MSSPIATHPTVLTDSSNVFRFWGGWTLVVVTCINCLASLVLLALIHYMIRRGVLKMNLYIWMVFLMSSSCFFWDATFFFELFMYKTNQDAVYQMMCGFFGISVGIWNFFIVAMVYWTSISANKDYHSANMNNGTYLKWLVAVNFVLSATVAVIMQSANHYYAWFIYDVARLLIAGCSILVLIFLAHTLLKTTTKENRYQSPLYHLLRRVALYPIGNIISRLGSIPYDQIYGIPLYAFPKNAGTSQTIVLFLFIVLTPACGVIDLIIFCRMQRGCSSLKDLLWRHPTDKDVEAKIKDKENRVSRCTGASNKKVRKKFKSAADERKSATAERKSTSHSPSLSSIEWNAPDSLRGSTDFSVAEAMDYRYTDSESSRSNSMDGDGNGDGDDHHFAREEYSRMSYMDEEELFAEMWADDSSPAETGKESIDKPTIQMRSVAGKAPAPHGTLNPVLGL